MSRVADADRIMYECGLEVLHPGGWPKTEAMARACGAGPGVRVLDLGGGRGTTACRLAHEHGCEVVGVDLSPDMVAAARERIWREGVQDRVAFRQADAHALPFGDAAFDVVLIECVSTLLDRERAFPEFRRVLKPGGHLGDLEMTYRREPGEAFARTLAARWDGFSTLTPAGWQALFRGQGLEIVRVEDFSERLVDMRAGFARELGLPGLARLAWKLLRQPAVARAMVEWDGLFREGRDVLGYAYFVARKV